MTDYRPLYYALFNAMTDAIEQLECHAYSLALLTLEQAQKTAEAKYMDQA